MPKKENIYCGMGDVPGDKVRGTAKQCIQANQVRYYGIKKIDKELIENKDLLNPDKELLKLKQLEMALKGMAKKLENEKNKKNVDQNSIDKLKVKIKKKLAEYKEQQNKHKKSIKYMKK
jgi:hypothetical protein